MELRKVTQLRWKAFLASEYGAEGMLWLREHSPSVTATDSTAIIFAAGKIEGYRNALDRISEIIAKEPEKEQNLENA